MSIVNFGLEAVSLHGRFNGASRDSSCRGVAEVMAKFGSSCCTANEIRRDHIRFNASDMSAMHKRPRRRGKLVAARGTEIPRHVAHVLPYYRIKWKMKRKLNKLIRHCWDIIPLNRRSSPYVSYRTPT